MSTSLPPGTLTFGEHQGLSFVRVTTQVASGTVYLHGAHLTAWQPVGAEPVIFLSPESEFLPGKPIRGGIPVVFPWFGPDTKDRAAGHPGPMQGFARLQEWTMESATADGEDVVLRLSLAPTALSRSVGFDHFSVVVEHRIGRTLTTRLKVTNTGAAPMMFEEALHTYFCVADIHGVTVSGLEAVGFLDKADGMTMKPAAGKAIAFTGPTDRVYGGACGRVRDPRCGG